jgi:hypothetical protein
MTNSSIEDLSRKIEQLLQEHLDGCRAVAREAIDRALSPARASRRASKSTQVARASGSAVARRTRAELAELCERLWDAVAARPGESMRTLAVEVGLAATELQKPMAILRQAGRVRSVGERHLMRYFPLGNRAAA